MGSKGNGNWELKAPKVLSLYLVAWYFRAALATLDSRMVLSTRVEASSLPIVDNDSIGQQGQWQLGTQGIKSSQFFYAVKIVSCVGPSAMQQ